MVKSTCHRWCGYQVRDGESVDVVFWKVVFVLWACNKRVGCIQRQFLPLVYCSIQVLRVTIKLCCFGFRED